MNVNKREENLGHLNNISFCRNSSFISLSLYKSMPLVTLVDEDALDFSNVAREDLALPSLFFQVGFQCT